MTLPRYPGERQLPSNSTTGRSGQQRTNGAANDTAAGGRTYSIDQLAAAAGVPSRTVRLYQSEGLLPPPVRRGRVGVYDDAHLERLRVIAQLQDRGLRLRAIRDALREVAKGNMSLDEWLGVHADLRTPWTEESPLPVSEDELHARLGERPPGFVAALVRSGLVQRHSDRLGYVIPSPGLLDMAVRLHAAGVDIEIGAHARELIRKRVRRAAAELVQYFARHTGAGFARAGTPQDVTEAMQALRTVGAEAVRLLFAQEIEGAVRDAVEHGVIRVGRRPRN